MIYDGINQTQDWVYHIGEIVHHCYIADRNYNLVILQFDDTGTDVSGQTIEFHICAVNELKEIIN